MNTMMSSFPDPLSRCPTTRERAVSTAMDADWPSLQWGSLAGVVIRPPPARLATEQQLSCYRRAHNRPVKERDDSLLFPRRRRACVSLVHLYSITT